MSVESRVSTVVSFLFLGEVSFFFSPFFEVFFSACGCMKDLQTFAMEERLGQTKKRSACAELIDGMEAGLCSYSPCNANDQWYVSMLMCMSWHVAYNALLL
jgi:hypothetical protein